MSMMASQITSLTIIYSTVYSSLDQRKHQSSASQAFVRGIHRWPVNSPHKGSVTRKMLPFDDVIMKYNWQDVFPLCGKYFVLLSHCVLVTSCAIRHRTSSILVPEIPDGIKPLSMLPYCQLDPREQTSLTIEWREFSFKKTHFKITSAKYRPCHSVICSRHLSLNLIVEVLWATFWNAFSWIQIIVFWFKVLAAIAKFTYFGFKRRDNFTEGWYLIYPIQILIMQILIYFSISHNWVMGNYSENVIKWVLLLQ